MNSRMRNLFASRKKRERTAEESYYLASQWQLMGRKFGRHKLAKVSLVVLGFMYLGVVFAGFIAPQQLTSYDGRYTNAPPTRIHFVDPEGRFRLRPFVYGIAMERDFELMRRVYSEDRTQMYPIRLFHRGLDYKFWGIFRTNLHLFGVDDPGRIFIFGTDSMGRDLFSRVVIGARVSLTIPFVSTTIALVLGVVIGGLSGYFGGVVDTIVQRIIEVLRSFPSIPLWMGLSAAIPPEIPVVRMYFYISVILSFIAWTGLARVVRSKFMSLREEDYVMAAHVAGCGTARIIRTHLVPGFLSYIIVNVTLSLPNLIIAETALSFIGLGIRSPATSWGVLLQEAQQIHNVVLYPWLMIPLFFVIVTVLAFNFLGDGLRDAADPYK